MSDREYISKNEGIVLGIVILIVISSYLIMIQAGEMNNHIMGAYFGGIFLGYWPVHNFIFKRNIYFGGFVATPEEKYKIQRIFGFIIGLALITFCVFTVITS